MKNYNCDLSNEELDQVSGGFSAQQLAQIHQDVERAQADQQAAQDAMYNANAGVRSARSMVNNMMQNTFKMYQHWSGVR